MNALIPLILEHLMIVAAADAISVFVSVISGLTA
jgi:hypothetical protein